jgi:peptidyl-dipeptidase Dcp
VAELPDFVKEILAAEAKAHEQEGWTVSLQPASMTPFLTYSSNRGYKEQVWKAYNSRCIGGELDNTELIKQITDLRLRSAQLLGYPTYADFVLEKRMAENPTTVNNFLDELLDATIGQARKEVAEVQRYARKNGAKYELMPWDFAYWSEKYKNATYAYNEEDVKPYFELNNVKNGIFALCDKLYGIKFVENKEVDGYHPDVQVYEVREENGELLGLLYMDFFPRATKRGGAWMTSFRDVYVDKDGKEVRPLISMCGNFTKPTETTPSLLTFDEFETFLHEFGHCLHGLFGKGSYASLTGTSVYRDFVELPSQIMENWCVEPEFLDMVATHYQTGEKMPAELRDKVIKAKKFLVAYYNTRQVAYATSDMQFHTITAPIADAVAFEKEARKECEVLPTVEGCSPCAAFSHIFSGGYAAGYYGYKWAEVLDADAYALFTEKGIFSKEVAGSFRDNILSKGGIRHPMDLYVAFRGHKPATQALIDEIVPRK